MNDTDKGLPELLPCPFCGGQPRLDQSRITEGFSVHCPNCDAAGGWHEGSGPDSAAQTVAAWNRRYLSAASGKAVAYLYEASNGCEPEFWMEFTEHARLKPRESDRIRNVRPLYLHPATVTDEDVERACEVFYADNGWRTNVNKSRDFMRAALSSFANKEMK